MDKAEVETWRRRLRSHTGPGTPFEAAVEREDWRVAALYLLLEAVEMLEELGPQGFEDLLDELDPVGHRGSRARKRESARGRKA